MPYVVSDSCNAFEMVREGGVIVWDDYGSMRSEYGTTEYLEQLREDGYPVFELGLAGRSAPDQRTGQAVLRTTPELVARFRQRGS